MKKLAEAIVLATSAHDGTFDKAGFPYIAHPFRVMQRLHNLGHSEEVLVAGMLHDTVEDTNVTIEDIQTQFGDEVARLVAAVTRGDETYMEFIARVKVAGSKAVAIKLADIADNTDLRRPRIDHLSERYAKATELLNS